MRLFNPLKTYTLDQAIDDNPLKKNTLIFTVVKANVTQFSIRIGISNRTTAWIIKAPPEETKKMQVETAMRVISKSIHQLALQDDARCSWRVNGRPVTDDPLEILSRIIEYIDTNRILQRAQRAFSPTTDLQVVDKIEVPEKGDKTSEIPDISLVPDDTIEDRLRKFAGNKDRMLESFTDILENTDAE